MLRVVDDGGGRKEIALEKLFSGRLLESFLKLLTVRDQANSLYNESNIEFIRLKNVLVANNILLGTRPIKPKRDRQGKGPLIEFNGVLPYFDGDNTFNLAPGDKLRIESVGGVKYTKKLIDQLRDISMVESLMKTHVFKFDPVIWKRADFARLAEFAGIKDLGIPAKSEEEYFNTLLSNHLIRAYFFLRLGDKKRFLAEYQKVQEKNQEKELRMKLRNEERKSQDEYYDRVIIARILFNKGLEELSDKQLQTVEDRFKKQQKFADADPVVVKAVRAIEHGLRRRDRSALRDMKKYFPSWKFGLKKYMESTPGKIGLCSHVVDEAHMFINGKKGSEISDYLQKNYATVERDAGHYCDLCGELTIPAFREGLNLGREGEASEMEKFYKPIEYSQEQKLIYHDIRNLVDHYVDFYKPMDERMIYKTAVEMSSALMDSTSITRGITPAQKQDTVLVYASVYNLAYLVRLFVKYNDIGSLKKLELTGKKSDGHMGKKPDRRADGGAVGNMKDLSRLMNQALEIIDLLHKRRYNALDNVGVPEIKKALMFGYKYMMDRDLQKLDKRADTEAIKKDMVIQADPLYHLWRIVKTISTGKAPSLGLSPEKILPAKLDTKVPKEITEVVNEYVKMVTEPDNPSQLETIYPIRRLTADNVDSIIPRTNMDFGHHRFQRKSNLKENMVRKNIKPNTKELVEIRQKSKKRMDEARKKMDAKKQIPSWKFSNAKIMEVERRFKLKPGPLINLGLSERYIYEDIENRRVDPHGKDEDMMWRISILGTYFALVVSYWMTLNYYEVEQQLPYQLLSVAKKYKRSKKPYEPDMHDFYERLSYYEPRLTPSLTSNFVLHTFCDFLLKIPDDVGKWLLDIVFKVERARSKIDEIKLATNLFHKEIDTTLDRSFGVEVDNSDPFNYDPPIDRNTGQEIEVDDDFDMDQDVEANTEGNL